MGSLVVFSPDVQRVAAFYAVVLGAEAMHEPSGDIRVVNDREEVLIHSMSAKRAANIEIATPPVPRESAPLKPVFDVESLERALGAVREAGGVITDRTFRFQGLVRHDVLDPDGNVVQLRCPTA
jgi:predicted enzyme related to lactoylglutathione lyase